MKGVILLAFGKREYHYMAAHMAMSIKHRGDIQITIVHDENFKYVPKHWLRFFDETIQIQEEHLYKNGKLDPGWAKVNIYNYLQYDENIYLDVDGICLKDLTPLFGQKKHYLTEVIGSGGKDDVIEYNHWATNDKIWKNFKLRKNATFHAVQSSFAYIKKGEKTKKMFEKMVDNFDYPKDDLRYEWGGTMPDELIISGTCAQSNYNPAIGEPVVFFGSKVNKKNPHELAEIYYVNSLYGNGKGNKLVKEIYRNWYDRMCRNIAKEYGFTPIQKSFQLMKSKHAG